MARFLMIAKLESNSYETLMFQVCDPRACKTTTEHKPSAYLSQSLKD